MYNVVEYKETLYGKKYVWFIIGWYPDNWYCHTCTVNQLEEALKFPSSQSTILHQEPRLTEVGMVTAQQFTELVEWMPTRLTSVLSHHRVP
ncbi:hypothetical protein RRG08_042140 [Elysia crispata]|uniref:Uncharacterized protein n=1 Tax=Elysia crispata TaxID=231223 RepID=A0AAE1A303_9GAST|nr:hypothetical protein RRG08_042140 [Elysia crispata]